MFKQNINKIDHFVLLNNALNERKFGGPTLYNTSVLDTADVVDLSESVVLFPSSMLSDITYAGAYTDIGGAFYIGAESYYLSLYTGERIHSRGQFIDLKTGRLLNSRPSTYMVTCWHLLHVVSERDKRMLYSFPAVQTQIHQKDATLLESEGV